MQAATCTCIFHSLCGDTPYTPSRPPPPKQELMRLNVFKGAAALVNAEDFIGRCKIAISQLAEVRRGWGRRPQWPVLPPG